MMASVAVTHLPAALAEIERLTAERAELRTIRDGAVRGLKDRIAALEAELAARAPADASRPTLTEEQAREMAELLRVDVATSPFEWHVDILTRAILRASRSKDGPASAKEMPSVKPCPAFFGLAGSVYGAQPGDRCDACKRTRAEHGASQ